jgi:O-antigen/teichoic acid export membrane protein
MTAIRTLAGTTAAFAVSNVLRAAVGFATVVALARGLATSQFGEWTFCMAWASTFTVVADLGFGVLLTRDAARLASPIGGLLANALAARMAVLVGLAIAVVPAAAAIGGGAATAAHVRIALLVGIAGAAYGCIAAVFRGWPEWLGRILAVETAGSVLQFAVSGWAVFRRWDVSALLWIFFAVQVVQLAAAAAMWRFAAEGGATSLEWPSWRGIRAAVQRAAPFTASGLIANAQGRISPLALGYLAGADQVATFGAAMRLGSFIRILPQSAFGGALPVFSREVDRGGVEPVRRLFDRVLACFALVTGLALALSAPLAIRLVYGRRFSGSAAVLVWIAVGLIPALVNSGRKTYLYAAGFERAATAWSGVALALQTLACVLLIPRFGASGAAAAIAVGEAAVWWPLRRADGAVHGIELVGRPVGIVGGHPLAGG